MRALVFLFLLLIFPAALAAAPTIDALTIIDPVSLNPDSTVIVICNSTFSDEDGYANVTSVNATFWDATSSSEEASDDENDHYTNSSCSIGTNTSNISAPVTCTFEVEYYANAAAWTCKINVFDDASSASNQTDTTVDTLLALSIPDSVNFGEMDRGVLVRIYLKMLQLFKTQEMFRLMLILAAMPWAVLLVLYQSAT